MQNSKKSIEQLLKENELLKARIASLEKPEPQDCSVEEKLKTSEKRLRTVLDSSPFPIAVVDVNNDNFMYWSNSAKQLFGHDPKTTQEWYELAYPDPDYRNEVIKRWKPFLEIAQKSSEAVNTGEYSIVCKDGSTKICEIYTQFILDNLIITLNDITERKLAEQALQESEDKFRETVNLLPQIIFESDLKGNLTYVNKNALAILGYPEDYPMLGKSALDLFTPESKLKGIENISQKVAGKNENVSNEYEMIRKDGSIFPALIYSTPIVKEGKPVGMRGLIVDITERKQADERHRTMAEMLNIAPSSITVHDTTGRFLYANQKTFALHGYTESEFMSINLHDLDVPESEALLEERFRMIAETGYATFEVAHFHKDGHSFPLEVFTKTVKWNGLPAILSIATDITERKQAEQELREAIELAEKNENELKKAQKLAHIGSWYMDIATNQVTWSEELYKMYGFDPALPVPPYTEHMKLFTPESWEILSSSLEHTRKTGIAYELELRTIRKDQSNGWMWVRGEVIQNAEGKTTALWGAAQDITEKKLAEEALIKSEALLKDTLRATTDGIWYWNFAEDKLEFSEKYYTMLGYKLDDFTSNFDNWRNMIHPEDRDQAIQTAQEWLKTKSRPYENHFRLKCIDGSYIWVRATGEIVRRDEKGNAILMIGNHEDITDRKKSEKEIEDKSRELEKHLAKSEKQRVANLIILNDLNITSKALKQEILERKKAEDQVKKELKEKNTLLQELYHRTKNNMQVISSMLRMEARNHKNEVITNSFNQIITKINAMALVHQMLYQASDLSRINLKEYIQNLVQLIVRGFTINTSKVVFDLKLENIFVLIDTVMPLGLAMNEMITNALKHAFPDNRGGKITISLRLDHNDNIDLTIKDNGVGIPDNLDLRKSGSMGLRTLFSLIEHQLQGNVEYFNDYGLNWHVKLKDTINAERV